MAGSTRTILRPEEFQRMTAGDGAAISDEPAIERSADAANEVMLIDLAW